MTESKYKKYWSQIKMHKIVKGLIILLVAILLGGAIDFLILENVQNYPKAFVWYISILTWSKIDYWITWLCGVIGFILGLFIIFKDLLFTQTSHPE